MAGNIKGITIEFRGDTTSLDKALRKVKNDTKGVDKELKAVNKSLKFNPNNTTLLGQKMTLLKQKITQTEGSLKELKAMQAQMDAKGVDKNSEQYRKLEREIVETESKLKHFKGELQKTAAQASRIGQLGQKFQDVGNKMTAAGNAMRGFSMAAAGVVAGIGAITYKAAANADEIVTMSKQYSVGTKELQTYSAAAELVDVDVNALTKAQVRMKRNMLSASKGTGNAASAFQRLGVSVTDSNGHLRNNEDVFNDTIKALGRMKNETERDALALQLFGRSAAELNPLIEDGGETYAKVTKIFQDNNIEFLSDEELGKANEFKDQIDIIRAVFLQAVNVIGSRLAGFLLPAMEKAQNVIVKITGRLAQISPKLLSFVGALAAVGAAIAPVLIVFGHLSTAIGMSLSRIALLIQRVPMLASALKLLTGPVGWIIAAFGLLFISSDKFRAAVMGLVTEIGKALQPLLKSTGKLLSQLVPVIAKLITQLGNTLAPIIKALTPLLTAVLTRATRIINLIMKVGTPAIKAITKAIGAFSPQITKAMTGIANFIGKITGMVKKIKSFFPLKLGKILDLKIPKISLKGGKAPWGIAGKGKLPSFNVEWHAQGGIFTRPTLLPGVDGNIHGVGERGAEAIVPLDKLWQKMSEMNGITINVYGSDNMSVNELASAVEQKLIQMQKRRTQAWA